jgi:hypothetical protein
VLVVRCQLLTPKRTRAVDSSEFISRMRATVIELILRFILGGLIVSFFAIIGDVIKPRTFAGLFAAAPSVALATLGLTIWIEGKLYAAAEARSMIVGAIALFVYAIVVIHLIMNHKLHAASATICAIPAWLICSVGTWFLVLR